MTEDARHDCEQGNTSGTFGEEIQVVLRQSWVELSSPGDPAVVQLPSGVTVREGYSPDPTTSGVFIIRASKRIEHSTEVKAVYEELGTLVESLRLVWPFAGGWCIENPLTSNHKEVLDRLFMAERGHRRFSDSMTISWNEVLPYRQMPLTDAIELLRRLGKLAGSQGVGEREQVLWQCLESFHLAGSARTALDKFMRTFPALDLLASMYYGEQAVSAEAKSVLRKLRRIAAASKRILGERSAEVLGTSLKVVGLRDKFEAFVKIRFPGEVAALSIEFQKYNSLRNDVFHEARYASVDVVAADATYTLLQKCLQAELGSLLEGSTNWGDN